MQSGPSSMIELSKEFRAALASRYTIEREIGRGRMGTFYLARDLRHDRPVALKVLHPNSAVKRADVRFVRETKLLAQLQHPNIIPLYDSGLAAGTLYYVAPYVTGESLRTRLEREGRLPVGDAVRIACEVASGLDYAHRRGVVHRDIKPENILLSDAHALVADFGFAKAIGALDGAHITTLGDPSPGTPAYMSPEQRIGARDIDGRSDIYSLGIVLYEMLTGQVPYVSADGVVDNARKYIEAPPSPRTLRAEIPRDVEQTVMKALGPRAADRFTSALELAHALTASLTPTSAAAIIEPVTAPLDAPAPAPNDPAVDGPRGTRSWVIIAAVAAIAALLAIAGVSVAHR